MCARAAGMLAIAGQERSREGQARHNLVAVVMLGILSQPKVTVNDFKRLPWIVSSSSESLNPQARDAAEREADQSHQQRPLLDLLRNSLICCETDLVARPPTSTTSSATPPASGQACCAASPASLSTF